MKKILAAMMAALLIFCMASCAKKEDNTDKDSDKNSVNIDNSLKTEVGTFEFGINDEGEYEITKYTPASVKPIDIELPKTMSDGISKVVGIAKEAFKAQNSVKSVKIPDSYTYIGKHAFYGCDSLVTVEMANSVTEIYEGAFQNCGSLATINISTSLKTLSAYTFANCVAITTADLSGETTQINEGAFLGCSSLTTVTLSEKIEIVNKSAFLECPKLTYTVSQNAKYLGNETNPYIALISAFDHSIESCHVEATTKTIAIGALSNCQSLKDVVLNKDIKFISGNCFTNSPWIEYTVHENVRYLGTSSNPYMVMISVITPADSVTVHQDTVIITDTALEKCTQLSDISYAKTAADWDNISKASNWAHDMNIIIHCSDKKVEA